MTCSSWRVVRAQVSLCLLACVAACGTTRENAGGEPPGVVGNGSVVIADITAFDPGEWEFQIPVPGGVECVLDRWPLGFVERHDGSKWTPATGRPGGPDMRGPSGRPQFPNNNWHDVHVAAGQMLRWREELCDWRVVAFPGRYRMRIRWVLNRELRYTPWTEFVVHEGAPDGALSHARDEASELWRAYRAFMNEWPAHGKMGMREPRRVGDAELRLWKMFHADKARRASDLLAVAPPTSALAYRLHFDTFLRKFLGGSAASEGSQRDLLLAAARAHNDVCRAQSGIYGELAKIGHAALLKRSGNEGWKQEVEALRKLDDNKAVRVTDHRLWFFVEPKPPPRVTSNGPAPPISSFHW